MKKIIDIIIKTIWIPIAIVSVGYFYTPTNFKWYRKFKGGVWYGYFPKMYMYMTFYTQDKDSIYEHEIIESIEDYNTYDANLIDDYKR